MFFIFVFLWLIAVFIYANEKGSTSDKWVAIALFLYGFGGLATVLLGEVDKGTLNWRYPAFFGHLDLLWGPVALIMFALHFVGIMPKDKSKKYLLIFLILLPILVFYILAPGLDFFGNKESLELLKSHTRLLAILVTPHYLGAAVLISWNLFRKLDDNRQKVAIPTFILSVPTSFSYYIFIYVLPSFGFYEGWIVCLIIMGFIVVLFMVFVMIYNIFGLSYFPENSIENDIDYLFYEERDALHKLMKANLTEVETNLDEILKKNLYNQDNPNIVVEDIQTAIAKCEESLSSLRKVNSRLNPVSLKKDEYSIQEIINDAINKSLKHSMNIDSFKNLQIVKSFNKDQVILCDSQQIRDSIICLLQNSLEAIPAEDEAILRISIYQNGRKLVIQIEDNGCGFEKKSTKNLCIPMHTTKNKQIHFGLGLYYVKKITEIHGGKFSIYNSKSGGTISKIMLPIKNRKIYLNSYDNMGGV